MMNRRRWSALAALLVTAAFLGLALRNVKFVQLWEVLLGARRGWIPVMIALILLDIAIRAARWRLLLSREAGATVFRMFRLEAIGLAVNNVLFMRLGELARALLASRELGVPPATALASVAVERALDVATLLLLFCLAAQASPALVPAPVLRAAAALLAGAVLALAMLIAAEGPLGPGGVWERTLRPWPRLHGLIAELAAGAAVLRQAPKAAAVFSLSLALWSSDALLYWVSARALGLGPVVDYVRAILILSWAGAGALLPAAPGAFGTFEAMVKAILVSLGVAPPQALGYAVFNHMMMYVIVTGLGLAFLYRVGLSLGELKSALERR